MPEIPKSEWEYDIFCRGLLVGSEILCNFALRNSKVKYRHDIAIRADTCISRLG